MIARPQVFRSMVSSYIVGVPEVSRPEVGRPIAGTTGRPISSLSLEYSTISKIISINGIKKELQRCIQGDSFLKRYVL